MPYFNQNLNAKLVKKLATCAKEVVIGAGEDLF
jgi:hypothetical protein